MNKIKNQSKLFLGFSLVEIIVVLSILSILVSIVITSFSKQGGVEALNTSTVTIISILNEAKSQAVSSKNASDYGVRIYSDKLISFENSYGTNNKIYTISNLVKMSTSTGIGNDIIFNNVSGSTNASGTITVTVLNELTKNSIINIYNTGEIDKN